jgi:hypothetical protein
MEWSLAVRAGYTDIIELKISLLDLLIKYRSFFEIFTCTVLVSLL